MFGLTKKLFASKASPIGVDFGSDELRLAQVRVEDGEVVLAAAASASVRARAASSSARTASWSEA